MSIKNRAFIFEALQRGRTARQRKTRETKAVQLSAANSNEKEVHGDEQDSAAQKEAAVVFTQAAVSSRAQVLTEYVY